MARCTEKTVTREMNALPYWQRRLFATLIKEKGLMGLRRHHSIGYARAGALQLWADNLRLLNEKVN